MSLITRWKRNANRLKTESYALFLAYKDPRTPWYAKVFSICILAYAFSPIDLIPDFIPVLGYLDDLILIPIGIIIAIKFIPEEVISECREKAVYSLSQEVPHIHKAAAIIIILWLIIGAVIIIALFKIFSG
jgi:uncharacterized membrane protein YkvA (DUF1232 family)